MKSLFTLGEFTSHSGKLLQYKIDCDALTADDLACLAAQGAKLLKPFSVVVGIPTGGWRLADLIRDYATPGANSALIVDDVYTTGHSMEVERARALQDRYSNVQGLVIFNRSGRADLGWVHRMVDVLI
jgi:orotate phosphoribosyltransferase